VHTTRLALLIALALPVYCESNNNPLSNHSGSARAPVNGAEDSGPLAQIMGDRTGSYTGQTPPDSMSPKRKKDTIDTTANAEYLTEIERQVIIEINIVRADPAEYAHRYLAPLRSYYRNGLLRFPGEFAISTNEGIRALDECIKELHVLRPLSPLSPKRGLTLAARDHVRDQARTGATGHTGSDRSTPGARISRYGKWEISAGENIDYGNGNARRIVAAQLIDDGVPSRGHRRSLLNGAFQFVGVSVGPHRFYRHMCVMDFAASYREADRIGPAKRVQ